MLRLKINGNGVKSEYRPITVDGMTYDKATSAITVTAPSHGLSDYQQIRFRRKVGNASFTDKRKVSVIDDDTFTFEAFNDFRLYVSEVEKLKDVPYHIAENGEISRKDFVRVTLKNPHGFAESMPCSDFIRSITDSYYEGDTIDHACRDGYVTYHDFVYQVSFGNELEISLSDSTYTEGDTEQVGVREKIMDKRYILPDQYENPEITAEKELLYKLDGYGSPKYLGGVIPLGAGLFYDNFSIYMAAEVDVFANTRLYAKNRIFYDIDAEGNVTLKDEGCDPGSNAEMLAEDNYYSIDVPAVDSFALDTCKEDTFTGSYIDAEAQKNVNKPTDYEKKMFRLSYVEGDERRHAASLKVNLHFRKKYDKKLDDGTVIDSWCIDDSTGWNNEEDFTVVDRLGQIGFDREDVIYQRKCLSQSFIRFLFYDTKDRQTQALQYYSTVFIDSGEVCGKYQNESGVGGDVDKLPEVSFTIRDSFDMTACSEGYYLYLFPSLLEGAKDRDIYMKVEFNHAKYGKTVQLFPSIEDNMQTYSPKKGYGDKTGIDVDALFDAQYIPAKIKYDEHSGHYVWWFPFQAWKDSEGPENGLEIDLYEPMVYPLLEE